MQTVHTTIYMLYLFISHWNINYRISCFADLKSIFIQVFSLSPHRIILYSIRVFVVNTIVYVVFLYEKSNHRSNGIATIASKINVYIYFILSLLLFRFHCRGNSHSRSISIKYERWVSLNFFCVFILGILTTSKKTFIVVFLTVF